MSLNQLLANMVRRDDYFYDNTNIKDIITIFSDYLYCYYQVNPHPVEPYKIVLSFVGAMGWTNL